MNKIYNNQQNNKKRIMKEKNYQVPISVLMPAYNCEAYIKEAIESIINQTFHDFELIVVDDGSTNDTLNLIKSFTDKRVVCVKNSHRGIVTALNTGLRIARGKYIARMDADDISYSNRLQKQYDFMESHPDVSVCVTHLTFENGQIGRCGSGYWKHPQQTMANGNILYHGTVMMRKQFLDQKKLYYRDKPYMEECFILSLFDRTYNQIIIIMTLFSGVQEQTLLRDCKRLNSNFDECIAAINRDWIAKEKIYLESVFTPDYRNELTKVFDVITSPA
jgi:glycosyltransferase involved in cell wall biosynthesis